MKEKNYELYLKMWQSKFKFIISIMMMLVYSMSNASVSVIDDAVLSQETKAVDSYISNIQSYLTQLSRTSNSVAQLTDLNGLIKEEANLTKECGSYCSKADMDKVKKYLTDLNTNISDRFKGYANILDNDVKTLNDVKNFIDNLSGNTKEIGIALQKATLQVQQGMNDTLLQIHSLLTLDIQKRQAEELYEKQNNNAIYNGFSQSGL